jgi:hypothetical protein
MGAGLGAGSAAGVGAGGTTGAGAATTNFTAKIYAPTATGASSSNPIGAYYANPLSAGKPGGGDKLSGMWTPLYTTTTTSTTTGITGNINTSSGMNSSSGQAASILNRRGPAYTVALSFPYEPPTSSQLQTEAQGILARSDFLTMRDSIKVKVNGQTLVLEGQVRSDQERRLAENMVRLTPGVRQIQNNLQVAQTAPPPRQMP